MHKTLFILIVTMLTGFAVNAQYAGYSPVNDVAVFKTQFSAAAQKTSSIKMNGNPHLIAKLEGFSNGDGHLEAKLSFKIKDAQGRMIKEENAPVL